MSVGSAVSMRGNKARPLVLASWSRRARETWWRFRFISRVGPGHCPGAAAVEEGDVECSHHRVQEEGMSFIICILTVEQRPRRSADSLRAHAAVHEAQDAHHIREVLNPFGEQDWSLVFPEAICAVHRTPTVPKTPDGRKRSPGSAPRTDIGPASRQYP
ncbi:hypothetical protein EVAR_40841_1 [Eumeta japonica]|uniref:Uncharacterized protein n=1 Tax=Eumeta variegata TaxID=151549 RepID=A0A4C1ZWH1_EUMVA|nr:hypothetical protein EVAR_40841_1 [Eumeta japonica]